MKEVEKLKKRLGIAIVILITGLIILSLIFLVYYVKPCDDNDLNCFSKALEKCNRVSLIREDADSNWLYIIKGGSKNYCNVEVYLLDIKKGTIDSEKLKGKKMICEHLKTEKNFPEKDISRCSGELKEEIQDLIIQRMHNYLLENLGDIKEEFEGV